MLKKIRPLHFLVIGLICISIAYFWYKAEQNKKYQEEADQEEADQEEADQVKTDQVKADQVKADQEQIKVE